MIQNKYFIGKISDAKQHLSRDELQTLISLLQKIAAGRTAAAKKPQRYVVLSLSDRFARAAVDRYIEAVEESPEHKSNEEISKLAFFFRDMIQASRMLDEERLPDA